MGKYISRSGWCGLGVACILFATSPLVHATWFTYVEAVLWPMSILQAAAPAETLAGLLAICFSALMNVAYYAGLAWLVWWTARLAGKAKSTPGPRARFISFFLAVCLSLAALIALAQAAIHRPQITAPGLWETYLISANVFSVIVASCAVSGWALWWLRDFLARRTAGVGPGRS